LAVIHLRSQSPASFSSLPRDIDEGKSIPLFGLAPGGVYPAITVTSNAVSSYLAFSPLPCL